MTGSQAVHSPPRTPKTVHRRQASVATGEVDLHQTVGGNFLEQHAMGIGQEVVIGSQYAGGDVSCARTRNPREPSDCS